MTLANLNKIDIIYEDNDIIVVNKPAFMLSIPDRYHPDKPCVYSSLIKLYGDVFIVHRLDKETSGVMCFARNELAHKLLNEDFLNRRVGKLYLALVSGVMIDPEGVIDLPLLPNPDVPGTMKVVKRGKAALTTYKVLEQFRDSAFVEIEIHSGRMHQIRVHFKYIGHPLMVDKLYSGTEAIYIRDIKLKKLNVSHHDERPEQPLISRVTLHASKLELNHPVTGERLTFRADMPKDMRATVNQLRKWSSK